MKWPTIISSVKKPVWIFSSTYLDVNSRQGKFYKINVSHTKFQPTLIRQKIVIENCELLLYEHIHQALVKTGGLGGHPNPILDV
jgi:hypothetical protein